MYRIHSLRLYTILKYPNNPFCKCFVAMVLISIILPSDFNLTPFKASYKSRY